MESPSLGEDVQRSEATTDVKDVPKNEFSKLEAHKMSNQNGNVHACPKRRGGCSWCLRQLPILCFIIASRRMDHIKDHSACQEEEERVRTRNVRSLEQVALLGSSVERSR